MEKQNNFFFFYFLNYKKNYFTKITRGAFCDCRKTNLLS